MMWGMKLFVLRERWGVRTSSPRKPWAPTDVQIEESKIEVAAFPGWMIIPDSVGTRYGPTLPMIMEWAWYGHMLARFAFGKTHLLVYQYVNWYIAREAAAYVLASKVGLVLAYTIPLAIMVGIMWIYNPRFTDFVWDAVFPWRYIGQYEDRLWWMDIESISSEGVGTYVVCGEIDVGLFFAFRNEYYAGGRADRWEFGDTWVQDKEEYGIYLKWTWNVAWVEYIGFMTSVGPERYIMKGFIKDPYVEDAPWPWDAPPALLCACARDIP